MSREVQPASHTIEVRGISLRYVDWGGKGPPMLMLHGDMRTSRSWDAVARELRSSFRVVAVDARGHGDSDWPPKGYAFHERVADLSEFSDRLGLSGSVGVGHSSGGVVMALMAQQRPEAFSHLVLLEPMVVVDESFHRMVSGRANQPRRTWASRGELREHLIQHPVAGRWRRDVIEDVVAHEAAELPDGSLDMKWSPHTFGWEERNGDHYDLRGFLRDSGVPVLFVVSGDRRRDFDGLSSIADEAALFRMVTIDGTGHNMYMERPDAVSKAIVAFVDGSQLPEAV